jgi:hypothetical protein
MAKITNKSERVLVVKAFPKCIFGLALSLLLVLIIVSSQPNQVAGWQDYSIFALVCLVFMAIQKQRITSFDKGLGIVNWRTVSVFGAKELEFRISAVESVEMEYGKGQYARGGAVYLQVKADKYAIADSDICIGNRKRNIGIKEEIVQWLYK